MPGLFDPHASFTVFAELAFINVEFGSFQFWVLVAVDFVMLVMRDVRAIPSALRASMIVTPGTVSSQFGCCTRDFGLLFAIVAI